MKPPLALPVRHLARRGERGADRSSRPLDHHRRPRKPDAPLRVGRQRAVGDGVDVRGVVNQPQVVPGDRIGHVQIAGGEDPVADQPFAQQPVLRHRKPVLFRQRQHERVGVEGFHRIGHGSRFRVHGSRCYSFTSMITLKTIDAHAAGEPLRLIVDGFPSPHGKTMLDKREWVRTHADHLRRALMLEPRGHADMYGAILTEPVAPGSHAGVLFMHNEGYSTMCGHGVIAVTTMALERGLLMPGRRRRHHRLRLARGDDTSARAKLQGGRQAGRTGRERRDMQRVESVSFLNVPSFVLHGGLIVKLGLAHDSRRRRVRRRLLRDRRQRGGRAADRRRAPARAAPRRHGDQARHRGRADDRAPAGCRPERDLRHHLHRAAERRAAPTCATSPSSPTPKSIARRAAPAPRR